MINTVLGEVEVNQLGITLTHEHILWSNNDVDSGNTDSLYDKDLVLSVMLPNLLAVRNAGCNTFVDATPPGCGRCVSILQEFSRVSGLNIITNTGAFLDFGGRYISKVIKEKDVEHIAYSWEKEFFEGIEGTKIKPGFIKIALSSDNVMTDLEVKCLKAASRVSAKTGLPIQCHVVFASKARLAVDVISKEKLSLEKFVWVHSDAQNNSQAMIELAKMGVWLEIDSWARTKKYQEVMDNINKFVDLDLAGKILLAQDSGTYGFFDNPINPCDPILNEFLPYCLRYGMSKNIMDEILIDNPAKVFNINANC